MIRLTLLLAVGLFLTMLVFGADDPSLQNDTIARNDLGETPRVVNRQPVSAPVRTIATPSPAPERVEVATEIATETTTGISAPETLDETQVDVARRETLDFNSELPGNDVLNQAPEQPAIAVEQTVAVQQPEVEQTKLLVVTGSRVNLRAGPSTGQQVVTQLARGDKAELLSNMPDGWVQIRDVDSGNIGYMSADFLSPAEPG